jgi:hypothetical protein
MEKRFFCQLWTANGLRFSGPAGFSGHGSFYQTRHQSTQHQRLKTKDESRCGANFFAGNMDLFI